MLAQPWEERYNPFLHREVTLYIGTADIGSAAGPQPQPPPSIPVSLALIMASEVFRPLFEGEPLAADPAAQSAPLELYLGWDGFPDSAFRQKGVPEEVMGAIRLLDDIYRMLADYGFPLEERPPPCPAVFETESDHAPPYPLPPALLERLCEHAAVNSDGDMCAMQLVPAVYQATGKALKLSMGIECLKQALDVAVMSFDEGQRRRFYAKSSSIVPDAFLKTRRRNEKNEIVEVMEPATVEELYMPLKDVAVDCRWFDPPPADD